MPSYAVGFRASPWKALGLISNETVPSGNHSGCSALIRINSAKPTSPALLSWILSGVNHVCPFGLIAADLSTDDITFAPSLTRSFHMPCASALMLSLSAVGPSTERASASKGPFFTTSHHQPDRLQVREQMRLMAAGLIFVPLNFQFLAAESKHELKIVFAGTAGFAFT